MSLWLTLTEHLFRVCCFFVASVSMREERLDSPGLHLPSPKHTVEYGSKQVDGSCYVEDRLPLFYGVLHKIEHKHDEISYQKII